MVGPVSVPLPTRVLIAGSGSIAQRHARNLTALGVPEVLVWTQRDVEGVESFATRNVRVITSVPDDCPNAAIVANDTDKHVATARELVAAGANVLIEKPVAARRDADLDALRAEVAAAGLVARVAYNLRFLRALGEVRSLLSEAALGQPLFARIEVGQWLPDWRPSRRLDELYSASASRGGGVALDLSHEVDYMVMLFGQPQRWITRSARTGVLGIAADDVFEGIYSYARGFTCSVHMDYLERVPRRRLRVVCSEGAIECDVIGGALSVTTCEGTTERRDPALFDTQATYVAELERFFGAIAGLPADGPDLPDLAEASDVLSLLADAPEERDA